VAASKASAISRTLSRVAQAPERKTSMNPPMAAGLAAVD